MAEPRVSSAAKWAFFSALGIAVVATLIGDGTLAWVVSPIVLGLSFYAMSKAPLRTSLLVLMFLALTLENPGEMPASGQWKSPFFMLGSVVLEHLNRATGVSPLIMSGMDILLVALAVIHFRRKASGSKLDRAGAVATPKPLIQLAHLSLVTTAFVWVLGMIRGGDNSMAVWQVARVIYLPAVFLLFQAGLRGPQDNEAIAKVVLAAATFRACWVEYVVRFADLPIDTTTGKRTELAYATSHHDSMLFAWAAVILVALIVHRAARNARLLAVLLGPILLLGMQDNQRRLVWVQILAVLAVLYFVSGMTPVKRKIKKVALVSAPLFLIYVALGWSRATGIFKPVSIIRSTIDSDVNASTAWRDVENFDLIFTIRQNPFFGTGYGHGFFEIAPLPQVDYLLERFIPHNSVLGLWCYGGYIGFTGMTLLWVAGVFFALRAYHAATNPSDKAAALVSFGAVPIYYLQCYGDMGLGSWAGVFMMASALAVSGKLAVATGAWRTAEKVVKLPTPRVVAQSPPRARTAP